MISATPAPAVPRARRRLPHPTLVWAIAAAWAVAVAAQVTRRGQALHHDGLLKGGLASWAALGLFLLAWQLMIAAMMLPSSLPQPSVRPGQRQPAQAAAGQGGVPRRLRRAVDRLRGRRLPRRPGHPPPDRPLGLAGHSAGTTRRRGPAAGGSVSVLDAEGPLPAGVPAPGRLPAAALPARDGRSVPAGRGHGVFCVGCCWALMLVAFAAGVANLWWMAALTAVMVFEKTGPAGQRGVRPIGLGLIVLGILVLADPVALPSTH